MVLLHKDNFTALIRSPGHERPKVAGSSHQPLRSISPLTPQVILCLCLCLSLSLSLIVLAPTPIDELRSQLGPSQKAVDGWLLLLLHYSKASHDRQPSSSYTSSHDYKFEGFSPPLPHVLILSTFPCVTSVKSVHAALRLHVQGHGWPGRERCRVHEQTSWRDVRA